MGVQVQILGPDQGTRMAPTSATKLAPTSSTRSITATRSRLGTSLLSLLLLPLSQALPQPAESQNWLARSTCVLDALAPGGIEIRRSLTSAWTAGGAAQMRVYRRQPSA